MPFKKKTVEEQKLLQEEKATKEKKKKTKTPMLKPVITPQITQALFKEYDTVNNIMKIDDIHYCVVFEYTDISFSKASQEAQESIFLKYVDFLNSHNANEHIQVIHMGSIVETKEYRNQFDYEINEDMPDNEKKLAKEFNELISTVIGKKTQTLTETRLITVTVETETIEEAKDMFNEYQLRLEEKFKVFKSKIRRYTIKEIMEIVYNTLNINTFKNDYPDEKNILDYQEREKLNIYDVIAPHEDVSFREKNYIKIGDSKYIRVMYLEKLPKSLSPRFYNRLTTIDDANVIITENISPTNPAKTINRLDKKISGMKTERLDKVKRAYKSGYSYDYVRDEKLEDKLDDAQSLRDALTKKKQKLYNINILICIIASSEKEMNMVTNKINKIAAESIVSLKCLDWQQLEGLVNCLPFGHNTLQFQRSMTSEACATSVPFNTKQLLHPRSIFYGMDLVSKSAVFCDRKKLPNGNGCVLATSGFGKSFMVKMVIEQIILRYPKDDNVIIDPQGEYAPVIEALGGQTIKISTSSDTYINPFDLSLQKVDKNSDPIKEKSEYILAFIESIIGGEGLTGQQKSIIDRCTKQIYENYEDTPENERIMPDFPLFYEKLRDFNEPEAQDLALILERYAHGSVDIFSKPTNVNIQNKLVCFDLSNLTTSMQTTGYLVVLEYIMNKLKSNLQEGKDTWIWNDEFHRTLANQFSAAYFARIYKEGRKFHAFPTIITQQIEDVLNSEQGRKILSNSEFALLLKQKPLDIPPLSKIFNISEEETNYVLDTAPGQGLIVYGEDIVAFKNTVPQDYYIYQLNQTSNMTILRE